VFQNRVAVPVGWRAVDVPAGGRLDAMPAADGSGALHLLAGPTTSASWRAKVILSTGRYRFSAEARTARTQKLPFGKNHGATLEVAGVRGTRGAWLTGDTPWIPLQVDFEVSEPEAEVELICAFRASAGEAWFRTDSLRLEQRP